MTHSLHRQGDVESLKNDYVMYARSAKGINMETAQEKLSRIAEIAFEEGLNNSGSSYHRASVAAGNWDKEIAMVAQKDTYGFICCYDDRAKIKRVLERLKEENLGISIVVSGLIDEVMDMAQEVGLQPHTINLSLGIRGKQELLPGPEVLEFTTMCGHSLVANSLARKAMEDVKTGARTPEEAARMMGTPCLCGIVNLTRAAQRLQEG